MTCFLGKSDDRTFSFSKFIFVQPEEVPSCSINDATKFNAKTGGKNAKTSIHYINIGSYVLAMVFFILSPKFSLFATNILKLSSVIYAPARLHGMPLLLLNQFLACSAGARIAWKTFRSIYFDTVGWCLNFKDIRIYCCAFCHWDCIFCISTIVLMQKIYPLVSFF